MVPLPPWIRFVYFVSYPAQQIIAHTVNLLRAGTRTPFYTHTHSLLSSAGIRTPPFFQPVRATQCPEWTTYVICALHPIVHMYADH